MVNPILGRIRAVERVSGQVQDNEGGQYLTILDMYVRKMTEPKNR